MIGFLIAGFVVGALARVLGPSREEYLDPLATIGLGITGSLVGGLVAWSFGARGRLSWMASASCWP